MPSKNVFKALRNEGLGPTFFRTLKVISMEVSTFLSYLPATFKAMTTPTVIKEINGSKMKLHLKDKGISRELYAYGKREHIATDLMLDHKIVTENDIVLDVGANIGYYALIESRIVGPQGKVIAVEPSPPNHKVLAENIALNNCTNVETHNLAMGDHEGTAEMYISNKSNWSRLSDKGLPDHIAETVNVPITTVDGFLKDKPTPTMLRMDVEGYETNILRGMKETLANTDIKIFVELHPSFMPKEELEEIFDLLEHSGYGVEYCFLNPSMIINPITEFAYKRLGEHDEYLGVMYPFTMQEAREWVINNTFRRLPHFLFTKAAGKRQPASPTTA